MSVEWVTVLSLLAFGQVDVRSDTDCPSAQMIAERLGPLVPDGFGGGIAEVRRLEAQAEGATDLYLDLFDPGLVRIGGRRLSLRGSCAQMAEAVAAILAAWKSNPVTSAAVTVAASAARQDRPFSVVASSPSRFAIIAGAGAGMHLVGGMAAGGSLELCLGSAQAPWKARLGFAAQTSRRLDLRADPYEGHVDWQHTSVALGLAWGSRGPRWHLGLDAGLVAGWATAAGSGFASNRTERSFEYGTVAALRGGRRWGRWVLWVEARPTLWFKGHDVRVLGSTASEDLPMWDLAVSVGASVEILP